MASNYKQELADITRDALRLQDKLELAESDLKVDGKNLEECCVKQASLLSYYDEISVRMKYNLNRVKLFELQMKGELYVHIKENSKKDYTDSAIKMIIDSNPEFVKLRDTSLMLEEIYDRAASVVESFKTRSFDLNNIIRIRENQLQDVTIRT